MGQGRAGYLGWEGRAGWGRVRWGSDSVGQGGVWQRVMGWGAGLFNGTRVR